MSNDRSGLLITVPAQPENVAVVRHAVAGLAEAIGMGEPGIGDLKTVVTEACMNVVVHAYAGEDPGPLEVEAVPEEGGLTVAVRDFGAGIRPNPGDDRGSLKIGLTLIAALSSSFSISGGLDRGTEVRMHVPLDPVETAGGPDKDRRQVVDAPEAGAHLRVEDPRLIAPVLERTIGVLAARHQITVDRLNDAFLVADAVSDRAPAAFDDDVVRLAVADGDGGLDLRIGPMPAGGGERLREGLSLPEVGGSLESLADEVKVEDTEGGDYLVVRFASIADDG
jgi:serine/threonine-protein kinase RsbW